MERIWLFQKCRVSHWLLLLLLRSCCMLSKYRSSGLAWKLDWQDLWLLVSCWERLTACRGAMASDSSTPRSSDGSGCPRGQHLLHMTAHSLSKGLFQRSAAERVLYKRGTQWSEASGSRLAVQTLTNKTVWNFPWAAPLHSGDDLKSKAQSRQ